MRVCAHMSADGVGKREVLMSIFLCGVHVHRVHVHHQGKLWSASSPARLCRQCCHDMGPQWSACCS